MNVLTKSIVLQVPNKIFPLDTVILILVLPFNITSARRPSTVLTLDEPR